MMDWFVQISMIQINMAMIIMIQIKMGQIIMSHIRNNWVFCPDCYGPDWEWCIIMIQINMI